MSLGQLWTHLKWWWGSCPLWDANPHLWVGAVDEETGDVDDDPCWICGMEPSDD